MDKLNVHMNKTWRIIWKAGVVEGKKKVIKSQISLDEIQAKSFPEIMK